MTVKRRLQNDPQEETSVTAAAKKAVDPAVGTPGPDSLHWNGEQQRYVLPPLPPGAIGWKVVTNPPRDSSAHDAALHASQVAEDAEDLADLVALFKAHGISTKKAAKLGKRVLRKWKFGFHG